VSKPHRRRPAEAGGRRLPAGLLSDPDYLAFKEQLGERLAPSERAILDAHRQAAHYRAYLEAAASAPGREGGGS
jgi:hypothetical protein